MPGIGLTVHVISAARHPLPILQSEMNEVYFPSCLRQRSEWIRWVDTTQNGFESTELIQLRSLVPRNTYWKSVVCRIILRTRGIDVNEPGPLIWKRLQPCENVCHNHCNPCLQRWPTSLGILRLSGLAASQSWPNLSTASWSTDNSNEPALL